MKLFITIPAWCKVIYLLLYNTIKPIDKFHDDIS